MNLMHSCRRVSELLSQQLDGQLGPVDRLRLRLHLAMCDDCQEVERQLELMHRLALRWDGADRAPGQDADPH